MSHIEIIQFCQNRWSLIISLGTVDLPFDVRYRYKILNENILHCPFRFTTPRTGTVPYAFMLKGFLCLLNQFLLSF
jgi:hypothetical protein